MIMLNDIKPVLVCGGAGYIGSHVVRYLKDAGLMVVVIDDLSTGHVESLDKNVEFVKASIGDRDELDAVFKRFDFQAVVHLCANAYVGESVTNPRKYYTNNVGNGLVLLETMLDNDVKQIVFSSSCTVYGYPDRIPIDEECCISPISPYGHTKAMFEQIMEDFSHAHGLRYCALRYFNAAGAIMDGSIGEDHDPEPHLIPLVLRQALIQEYPNLKQDKIRPLRIFGDDYATLDGTCVRDYIHVMDLACAHGLALDFLKNGGESIAINLANETGYSVLQIIHACEKITGHTIPYEMALRRLGDPDELVGVAAKASRVLGWRPLHSDIQDIISSAWSWHKTHLEKLQKSLVSASVEGEVKMPVGTVGE